jgi:16S rRNA (uracil1498-N3)-methyltransferase
LSAELLHHIKDVLRLAPGATLRLSDGAGREADATLLPGRETLLEVGRVDDAPAPPGPRIRLAQAVGKGDKMDAVVRQATELGVEAIVPVLSARAVAERSGRLVRWQAIAEDAVRVSGRSRRPSIGTPIPLPAYLAHPRLELALVFAGGASLGLRAALERPAAGDGLASMAVELLVGPEGGLDESELASAEAAGFTRVHLGPHNLRTETAGPAAIAAVLYAAGGLDRPPPGP